MADLPRMLRVRQTTEVPRLHDVPARLDDALRAFGLGQRLGAGDRVALAVGSRGIRDLCPVLRTLVRAVREAGASPFVVPCMGSHGGATAAGQEAVLAELGVTEAGVGAPVVSSMEAAAIGRSRFGGPVWASPDLLAADAVVVVNRVKPHTDFSGPIESGIAKMLVIGAGKHRGAVEAHRLFVRHGFTAVMEEYARLLLHGLPVLAAVAIVENQADETAELHVLGRDDVLAREPELLRRARELMPALPFARIDCLLVDEMGKDISGSGMDANVIGRKPGEARGPVITRIVVRDLTEASEGNALGIGYADFTTTRLLGCIDRDATVVNAVTAMAPDIARAPLAFVRDLDALEAAYATSGAATPEEFRLVWIRNTLEVGELLVSEALSGDVAGRPGLEVLQGPVPLPLDEAGALAPAWHTKGAGRER